MIKISCWSDGMWPAWEGGVCPSRNHTDETAFNHMCERCSTRAQAEACVWKGVSAIKRQVQWAHDAESHKQSDESASKTSIWIETRFHVTQTEFTHKQLKKSENNLWLT